MKNSTGYWDSPIYCCLISQTAFPATLALLPIKRTEPRSRKQARMAAAPPPAHKGENLRSEDQTWQQCLEIPKQGTASSSARQFLPFTGKANTLLQPRASSENYSCKKWENWYSAPKKISIWSKQGTDRTEEKKRSHPRGNSDFASWAVLHPSTCILEAFWFKFDFVFLLYIYFFLHKVHIYHMCSWSLTATSVSWFNARINSA